MKKLLFIALALTIKTYSQLPNSNMENWLTAVNGSDSLVGWTSDNYYFNNVNKALNKETQQMMPGAFQGNYAVRLQSYGHMGVQNASIGMLVNGKAKISSYPTITWVGIPYVESGGGTPISYKPAFLKGFYIYNSSDSTDYGSATVILSRYNVQAQKRDTVALGSLNLLPNTSYQQFTVQINDLMPSVNPDTITTLFYSSNIPSSSFASLFLDSLTLSASNSINEENSISHARIFPNPSSGIFLLELQKSATKNEKLQLIDILGKQICSYELKEGDKKIEINISELNSGIYFIKSGSATKKIIKK